MLNRKRLSELGRGLTGDISSLRPNQKKSDKEKKKKKEKTKTIPISRAGGEFNVSGGIGFMMPEGYVTKKKKRYFDI